MKNLRVLFLIVVAGFFSSAVAAKTTCAGVVRDKTGAVIPHAQVAIVQDGKAITSETDASGTFSFQGESAPYNVEIKSPGYMVLTVNEQSCEIQTPSEFRLSIGFVGGDPVHVAPQPDIETTSQSSVETVQISKLSGHVQDREGTSLAGADVSVKIGSHEVAHAKTDANGIFSFGGDPGTYDVSITEPKYAPLKSALVTFAVGKPQPIILKPVGFLAGEGLEYGFLVQGGTGLEQNSNFKFLLAGVHAGMVLTPEYGHGMLKGNFEYAVEAFPFWQSYTPTFQKLNCPDGAKRASQCKGPTTSGGTYRGMSITPIILRWYLTSYKRWMPWIQGAGGVLYTTRKYPGIGSLNVADPTQTGPSADTSVWNFTPQFGIGTHYFFKPRQAGLLSRRSLDFSANAIHISSASLGDKNPGVNTGVQFSAGYSWWK